MSRDDAALAAILDALIPGDARWPAFSTVVAAAAFVASLEDAPRERLWSLVGGQDPVAALAAWEAAEPGSFASLLRAVHRAYYTAPAVVAVIHRLAEASPRETSELFDPALVTRVVATGAGRRRL